MLVIQLPLAWMRACSKKPCFSVQARRARNPSTFAKSICMPAAIWSAPIATWIWVRQYGHACTRPSHCGTIIAPQFVHWTGAGWLTVPDDTLSDMRKGWASRTAMWVAALRGLADLDDPAIVRDPFAAELLPVGYASIVRAAERAP